MFFSVITESRAMNVQKVQEIIRLWNVLRVLQREGRPSALIVRKLEKALAERERMQLERLAG